MEETVKVLNKILQLQEKSCMKENGFPDVYNIGLYNGIAIALAILNGDCEPKLYNMEGDDNNGNVSE